jgi:hypothetical protein
MCLGNGQDFGDMATKGRAEQAVRRLLAAHQVPGGPRKGPAARL